MNIDESLTQMFNEQMNREYFNALCYSELAGVLESAAWDGYAKWMRKAAKEELEHYQKFNDFLVDRNAVPTFSAIPQPPDGSTEPLAAFNLAMALEKENTMHIIELDKACENADDCDAEYWLIWALEEQRRSEREIQDILIKMARFDCSAAWLMLDKELGKE